MINKWKILCSCSYFQWNRPTFLLLEMQVLCDISTLYKKATILDVEQWLTATVLYAHSRITVSPSVPYALCCFPLHMWFLLWDWHMTKGVLLNLNITSTICCSVYQFPFKTSLYAFSIHCVINLTGDEKE